MFTGSSFAISRSPLNGSHIICNQRDGKKCVRKCMNSKYVDQTLLQRAKTPEFSHESIRE